MAETYAIVESGGKQYRAEKGTTLVVDRLAADEGAKVNLRAVMLRDGTDVVLESDKLEKVKVEATVTGHERGEKIRVFKYRAKKGYRKRAGHRSELTRLEVTEVKLLTRKPAAPKAEPKPKEEAATEEATEKPAAKPKAPAKKPAAKKPAAKTTAAAKKPAAKRPATTKKPAAKKPAAKKTEEDG
jgi:large subunit ribosomal protein L21